MATVNYTISSGEAPFTAELTPSLIPANVHAVTGTYQFTGVTDGGYTLTITDSNGCNFQQELTINQFVQTTTTTLSPFSIVVGNAQDEMLIFDIAGTNIYDRYVGSPNPDVSTLYLWLKTHNGQPLTNQKIIDYIIKADTGVTDGSTFIFNDLSDWVHANVVESVKGTATTISGQIILKPNFIETYFMYTYNKDETTPGFEIDLSADFDWLYPNVPLIDETLIYGVTYIDTQKIVLNY